MFQECYSNKIKKMIGKSGQNSFPIVGHSVLGQAPRGMGKFGNLLAKLFYGHVAII